MVGDSGFEPETPVLSVLSLSSTNLVEQLLNGIISLGEIAKQLKLSLGSNGHRSEKLNEIRDLLERRME